MRPSRRSIYDSRFTIHFLKQYAKHFPRNAARRVAADKEHFASVLSDRREDPAGDASADKSLVACSVVCHAAWAFDADHSLQRRELRDRIRFQNAPA